MLSEGSETLPTNIFILSEGSETLPMNIFILSEGSETLPTNIFILSEGSETLPMNIFIFQRVLNALSPFFDCFSRLAKPAATGFCVFPPFFFPIAGIKIYISADILYNVGKKNNTTEAFFVCRAGKCQ